MVRFDGPYERKVAMTTKTAPAKKKVAAKRPAAKKASQKRPAVKKPATEKAPAEKRAAAKKKAAATTAVKKKAAARRPAIKKTMLHQSLTHTPGRFKPIGDIGPHPIRTIPPRRQVQRVRERLPTPQEVREGIDTDTLDWLRDWLHVSDADLNEVLLISRSTRRRREASGTLTHEESDRAANVLRAIVKAIDYFEGDETAARRWMKHNAPSLGGETPLRHCDTAIGAQRVIRLLSRLEYGIPT